VRSHTLILISVPAKCSQMFCLTSANRRIARRRRARKRSRYHFRPLGTYMFAKPGFYAAGETVDFMESQEELL
jgi:hypothetical protein